MSDLYPRDSPSHSRSKRTYRPSRSPGNGTVVDDMIDNASVDTDVLLSQPIYGMQPVNMGGHLHKSLYEDKKVTRLKKESTKKLKKRGSRARPEWPQDATPHKSKALLQEPRSASPRMRENMVRHLPSHTVSLPLKTADLYPSYVKQREVFPSKSQRYSLPPEGHPYRDMAEHPGWRSASPQLITEHKPPPVSRKPFYASSYRAAHTSPSSMQAFVSSPGKSLHSTPLTIRIPSQKDESDAESTNTDKEMRKSPTGIKMEKMYREPSTMYPWKTMIQSSRSVHTANQDSFSHKHLMTQDVLGGVYDTVGQRNPYTKSQSQRVSPHWSAREGVAHQQDFKSSQLTTEIMSTPKPIFASSGYGGSHREIKESSLAHKKPPPGPQNNQRRRMHRYLGFAK